jgi:hypothetical protein
MRMCLLVSRILLWEKKLQGEQIFLKLVERLSLDVLPDHLKSSLFAGE